jgi:hypothetical protein
MRLVRMGLDRVHQPQVQPPNHVNILTFGLDIWIHHRSVTAHWIRQQITDVVIGCTELTKYHGYLPVTPDTSSGTIDVVSKPCASPQTEADR